LHLGGVLLEGSDTCSAALQNMILALAIYPDVQQRIHQELDSVVGSDSAPQLSDLPNLRYTMAFIEECNRFRPVGPLGLPHEMTQDEVVNGFLYPKGAVVFINIWGMGHDERYFEDPETFNPDRFIGEPLGVLDRSKDDPARRANMQFGGGKRVCPGIAFAKSSLELNIANLTWAFTIKPEIDGKSGLPVDPDMDSYGDGVTATPKRFPLRIFPRSQQHRDVIERQLIEVQSILSQYE